MTKNTGKPSEDAFDEHWRKKGKAAFVYAFPDSSSLTGLNGRQTQALAQPCDRLVCHRGEVEYAEVKSTQDETAFRFSMLRTKQKAFAAFVLASGGTYVVYVHSLIRGVWFRIPYSQILFTQSAGFQSIQWDDLQRFQWNIDNV
jgi:hypothetical protein